jgi:hypothetical protein
LVHSHDELRKVPWEKYPNPIAVEYIDVRNADGFFRKYRCFFMGNRGLPRHLYISENWSVRNKERIINEKTKREEQDFVNLEEDPNYERLNRAREALGFDYVAFDYSYAPNGELVVWEPNPFPVLWSDYRDNDLVECYERVLDRVYSILLEYYLVRAGMTDLI